MCDSVILVIIVPVLFYVVQICAMENLALNKHTWQEHPWPDSSRNFGSENAVDGLYTDRGIEGQCTINSDGYYTAEWRVDLGSVVRISHINIYYRTRNMDPGTYVNRMAGFFLYVSNTTLKDQGHLCYKDESEGTPSVNQNISCSIYGRYVIYYNERNRFYNPSYLSTFAHNELCEVEVYGCRWNYGNDCLYACPTNCLNGECGVYTGHCLSCLPGYHGQFCGNECNSGYYGKNCSYQCNRTTGECEGGCKSGWTGYMCDKMCESGYYGDDCRRRCSINCDVAYNCDRVTGKCNGGCKSGWTGSTCDQMCESAYYDKNCFNQCSINCATIRSCDRFTGECDKACKPGWTGITCDQECMIPYYGKNCLNTCSAFCNVSGRCDKITGHCDGGCKPGWKGNTCDQKISMNMEYHLS